VVLHAFGRAVRRGGGCAAAGTARYRLDGQNEKRSGVYRMLQRRPRDGRHQRARPGRPHRASAGLADNANVSITRIYDHRKTRPEDSPVFKVSNCTNRLAGAPVAIIALRCRTVQD